MAFAARADGAPLGARPPAEGWRIGFVDNPELPPQFRQGAVTRPDGSTMTFFLGNHHDNLEKKRPLLIYLEGSGAQSHFIRMGDRIASGVVALISQQGGDRYHVATIEKRGVRFAESQQRGTAVGASEEYTRHATLAERAADVRRLLDALLAEPAIDASRVVLLGHSEGADVAAAVAADDPRVTHVAFLSGGGAAQLYDFFIMRRKKMAADGFSPDAIEQAIVALEHDIRAILAEPQSETKQFMGHAYKRWATFATTASAENLVRTRAKVFIGHGTADGSVPIESFDYLVLRLLIAGRNDMAVRRYVGRDHSFISAGEEPSGAPFAGVVREVLAWADGQDVPSETAPLQ